MVTEGATLNSFASEMRLICPNLINTIVFIGNEEPYLKAEGAVALDAEYEGVRLVARFDLEIIVPSSFPCDIPRVCLCDSSLSEVYPHASEGDGELCLGVTGDILMRLASTTSPISTFLIEILRDNLYSVEYYRRYHAMPFGDRSHCSQGVLEHYVEFFDTNAGPSVVNLIRSSLGLVSYDRNHKCPCGSGKKALDCHGKAIERLKREVPREMLRRDYVQVLDSLGMTQAILAKDAARAKLRDHNHRTSQRRQ